MADKILIVDDDEAILALVSDVLRDNGMEVVTASSAKECLRCLENDVFDLIVLDVMMEGVDGFELCRQIRGSVSCPIIFLSARDSVRDIVEGLSLGADDYLTKPFALDELVARISAHLRRQNRTARPAGNVLRAGDITLNLTDRSVRKAGQPVTLSTREFDLLAYLMQNPGKTISREELFRGVWHTEYGDIGAVAINIKNLREKVDPGWDYIKTIWGAGYRFAAPAGFAEGGNG